MKQFKKFVEDTLFCCSSIMKIHHFTIAQVSNSDALVTALTIALISSIPSSQQYGEIINIELKRLETVGEALIELIFNADTVTSKKNYNIAPNDCENRRIQILKVHSLNDHGRVFGLEDLTLINEKDRSTNQRKRDLYEVIHALAGALGLWAGFQAVIHLLQLLKIIDFPEKEPQNQEKSQAEVHNEQEKERKSHKEDKKEGSVGQQTKNQQVNKSNQDKDFQQKSESTIEHYQSPQDSNFFLQAKDYSIRLNSDIEFQNCLDGIYKGNDTVEKEIEDHIKNILKLEDKQICRYLFQVCFVDRSYLDQKDEEDKADYSEFFKNNFSNYKLQMIGSSLIKLMIKSQLYYYSMGDPAKSRISRELKTAEKIEEHYHYASSSPMLSYILYIKFIVSREEINPKLMNLIYSEKNQDLAQRIKQYSKLFNQSGKESFSEMSTMESTNNSSVSTKSYQTKGTISINSIFSTSASSLSVQDGSQLNENLEPNKAKSLLDVEEQFLPEYANSLLAIIGAVFIQSMFNLEHASLVARNLLYINEEDKFPVSPDKSKFFQKYWNKPYNRILRLHHTTERSKVQDELYYKVFIQTLEIRRVKFKTSHSNRLSKMYRDLTAYMDLANQVFESKYKLLSQQTPYNYILFQQQFRKIYKVSMTLQEAEKMLPSDLSSQDQITQGENEIDAGHLKSKKTMEFINIMKELRTAEGKTPEQDVNLATNTTMTQHKDLEGPALIRLILMRTAEALEIETQIQTRQDQVVKIVKQTSEDEKEEQACTQNEPEQQSKLREYTKKNEFVSVCVANAINSCKQIAEKPSGAADKRNRENEYFDKLARCLHQIDNQIQYDYSFQLGIVTSESIREAFDDNQQGILEFLINLANTLYRRQAVAQ